MENMMITEAVIKRHLIVGGVGLGGPNLLTPSEGERSSGVSSPTNASIDQNYLEGLIKERETLGIGPGMDLTRKLINQEIERVQNGGKITKGEDRRMSDVTKDKSIKLTVKVLVPVKDHPKFNFVGKLLGPKGNSLKRLQEETMTKMAILGRGSMRDKQKEEELRISGDQKFNHLADDLHVEVAAVAPPAEAHARIAYALTEIRRYLVPDYNDEIRQEQMREMQIMNCSTSPSTSTTNSILGGTINILNGGPTNGISEDDSNSNSPNNNNNTTNMSSSNCSSLSPSSSCTTSTRNPSSSSLLTNKLAASSSSNVIMSLSANHPALRGLSHRSSAHHQTSFNNQNKDSHLMNGGGNVSLKTSRLGTNSTSSSSQSRRSVLSLLTKARAIQQKEHQDIMGVFQDLPSYFVNDHGNDLTLSASKNEESNVGRNNSSGVFKVTSTPSERSRFRHDPYPRVASLT